MTKRERILQFLRDTYLLNGDLLEVKPHYLNSGVLIEIVGVDYLFRNRTSNLAHDDLLDKKPKKLQAILYVPNLSYIGIELKKHVVDGLFTDKAFPLVQLLDVTDPSGMMKTPQILHGLSYEDYNIYGCDSAII